MDFHNLYENIWSKIGPIIHSGIYRGLFSAQVYASLVLTTLIG